MKKTAVARSDAGSPLATEKSGVLKGVRDKGRLGKRRSRRRGGRRRKTALKMHAASLLHFHSRPSSVGDSGTDTDSSHRQHPSPPPPGAIHSREYHVPSPLTMATANMAVTGSREDHVPSPLTMATANMAVTGSREDHVPSPLTMATANMAVTGSREDHVPSPLTMVTAVNNPLARDLVALDCEMVSTRHGSALAQCSIISYDGETLFHSYVRPSELITDYRTRWSGVRPHHMKWAVPHEAAVGEIRRILNGKIVIGHDLVHDLAAIGISISKHRTRDTAHFKPLRTLAGLISNQNPSLKRLALRLLGRQIQVGCHNSLEDAVAALDLYRKYERLWENHLVEQEWDTAVWLQDCFWPKEIVTN